MENIKEQLEEVIKKNLPEKEDTSQEKFIGYQLGYLEGFNQALSQINTSLIADEVLNAIITKIYAFRGNQILMFGNDKLPFVVFEGKADEKEKITIYEQAFKDIINYLSPIKENENNE